MKRFTLGTWIALLILPLIPVVILYAVFAGQNYFELRYAAKGIVALGPIAAYVAIVWLGWRLLLSLEREGRYFSPLADAVAGEWEIASESTHHTLGTGNCTIVNDRGILTISGDLSEEGSNVASWRSEIAVVKGNMLYIYYSLTQIRSGGRELYNGMCTLQFGAAPVDEMKGIWIVAGGERERSGTITLTRKR
jgi:hypothetical protein